MYEGYLDIGGVEVMNAPRTVAYLRNFAPNFGVRDQYPAPDLAKMLLHDEYRSPALDGAPWYTPHDPDSADFLGWLPTAWTGFGDSSLTSEVVELSGDGAVATGTRLASKQLLVRGVLLATTDHALEFGMSWLRGVFEEADCRGGEDCAGEELTFLSSTPQMCEGEDVSPMVGDSPYHDCLVSYLRQYHRVTTMRGPKVVARYTRDSCMHLIEVEVLLNAGVPHIFTWPTYIGRSQAEPTRVITNLVTDPNFAHEESVTPSMGSSVSEVPEGVLLTPNVTSGRVYGDIDFPAFEPGRTYTLVATMTGSLVGARPAQGGRVQIVYRSGGTSQSVLMNSEAPSESGAHTVRMTFTVPVVASDLTIRMNGFSYITDTTLNELLIADADALGSDVGFFSGDSIDADFWVYSWSGNPDESFSVAEYNNAPPFVIPEVTCDPTVDPVVLRENLATNPRMLIGNGFAHSSTWTSVRFDASEFSSGMLGIEQTLTIETTSVGGLSRFGGLFGEVTPGEVYSIGGWMRTPVTDTVFEMRASYSNSGTPVGSPVVVTGASVTSASMVWRSITMPPVPAGANEVTWAAYLRRTTTAAPIGSKAYWAGVLIDRAGAVGPYFDGGTPDTEDYRYEWTGTLFNSTSVAYAQDQDYLRDPDCTFVPSPPQPPLIEDDCLETPDTWTRYSVQVEDSAVPGFAASPRIAIQAGEDPARQIRVRVYPDPGGGVGSLNECDYIGEFIITYLPAGAEIVLDGRVQTAMVTMGGSNDARSALHLLRGSDGRPFIWPVLRCHDRYVMTADFSPEAPTASAQLWLAGRT